VTPVLIGIGRKLPTGKFRKIAEQSDTTQSATPRNEIMVLLLPNPL